MIVADAATNSSGGLFVLIGLFIIVLAAVWITFPFIVMSGLRRIEKLLAKQNQTLDQIADRQNETNCALLPTICL